MISFARWFFLGILIYAPWAYGCTRPWTIHLLNVLLWSCGGLCLLGWMVERHRPRLPWVALTCLTLIVLQAGWMWYNARAYFDDSFWQFIYLDQPYPPFTGSWNKAASWRTLQSLTGLLVAFVIASDLVGDRLWRERLWTTLGLTGGSIILYGLAQRSLHAPSIFWLKEDTGNSFFGPYRYHANAGAYLNLVWPVLAILMVEAWKEKDRHVARALWVGLFLLGLAACFVNMSRGSSGVTLLLLVPALLAFLPFFREQLVFLPSRTGLLVLLLLAAFMTVLVLGGAVYQTQGRWGQLGHQLNDDNPRLLVYQATSKMVPAAGWLGFGPGTFSTMFPFYSSYLGNRLWGFWVYAHEDYLQTLVEYGYAGTALWTFLFFGGLAKAIRGSFNSQLRTHDRIACRGVSLALAGVALHSMVDFPLQVYSIQLYVMVFLAYAWTRTQAGRHKRITSLPTKEQG